MNKTVPIIAFATLILAGCTGNTTMNTTTPSPVAQVSPEVTKISLKDVVVKDGTYEADGAYVSPGGSESVGVKMTLTDGLITDVVVSPHATLPKSVAMQTAFAGGIKELVVGKKIADLNITKVAGSSLTSGGFNQALEKIAGQM